ncbi:3,4-dehydroadipyl-CoA semialdehyde dehydrogenase [Bordetella holmesii]|uniref:3,4-dehydroadipyl-CoA semialdehyde dehydrogenase n=1 Tax=Bordetella holmesii TaxID=35814 RepID=UPI00129861AF|nr:3,4-dehydroadipyl-CoA semialdehyde dehydrogenase [Bordetella holmesii]QGB06625.1 3,4-dehydroadipyl-CoA semialdehyde dehydrogenase [Bordetella holmesii]QGB14029.1 3,4-dehydroadipyl-CoA semialdehyde dehydrogenase [Bordetella holmesii]QGC41822.1 3,4-dehydroadipyl-CoA semialdehyde dehydrogenase [Bordetella holmesii]QGC61730.1 3,4-dehydroadipyl-CoA semialdehyde dehydrogenase [Bordetella holmesii]QJP52248.1 3,4-dehydroadipyl-CoA semialdehyde dehydrogenase [Bordetella holmesii]
MHILENYVAGQWRRGEGQPATLRDPVRGTVLAGASSAGLDLPAAFAWAREQGGAGLRALSYAQRAALLSRVGEVLSANREKYFDIALANSGTVQADSAIDIDGAIYTVGYYAKQGSRLTEDAWRMDGAAEALARDDAYAVRHVWTAARGLALFINAFNFPSWGLWEKAAPALLSGVPIVIKPATSTAWLTHEMVADVVKAAALPEGAISLICGGSAGLLNALRPLDLLSFTGSADTAAQLRAHPALMQGGVRLNAETDSVNSAILGPDAAVGSPAFDALVREVVREMRAKSGQKCTAIRRIMVAAEHYDAVAQAVSAQLARITVGDPRNPDVKMGSLVSRVQFDHVQSGLSTLRSATHVLFDGATQPLIDADPAIAACMAPTLLGSREPQALLHRTEVFGPVATLMPYRDTAQAWAMARQGEGSLVASLYSDDTTFLAQGAQALAESHGRVHLVTPEAAKAHTGHGNVMPQSLHGGPGRAGGGQELGGLRAMEFYHRRSAVQGAPARLEALPSARVQEFAS